jgi:hypothetical protein
LVLADRRNRTDKLFKIEKPQVHAGDTAGAAVAFLALLQKHDKKVEKEKNPAISPFNFFHRVFGRFSVRGAQNTAK